VVGRQTTKAFDDARGGVVFIDEVYALGNERHGDVFTKECIDTINQLLTERQDTLCIIAGYESDIEKCFFSYNKGLERRFPWKFTIDAYTEKELLAIFYKKVVESGWTPENKDILKTSDIKNYATHFVNAGGDIENFLQRCLICSLSSKFMDTRTSKILTREDVLMGLEAFIQGHKTKVVVDKPPPNMYI
jgi:SpoVK/Ycf46/Vps4 family AAA+-type ATPase